MTHTRSGRSGTGHARYRKSRAIVLAESDRCWLCGHGGAMTADHVVTDRDWPRDAAGRKLPGFDDPDNLRPAHGTMGPYQPPNPCPTCDQLCNQVRNDRPVSMIRSRDW